MVDRWWTTIGDGGDAPMVAAHYDRFPDLNVRAWANACSTPGSCPAWRCGSDRDREFAVDDQVLVLANDYSTGVLNGTRGTIAAIDEKRR